MAKPCKKIICFLLIIILLVIIIWFVESYYRSHEKKVVVSCESITYPKSNGEIVSHSYYMLAYNEEAEQPYWVYYLLTADMLKGKNKRSDLFKNDVAVSTKSAYPQDYSRSGYDKGHLCPAADMKFSAKAMQETFLMSNMSPQKPQFNRGVWRELESKVREWVKDVDSLWVVSGPVFKDCHGTIGKNEVLVPGYYYKVLYMNKNGGNMIAFVLRNEKTDADISNFVVSVDSVESLTQIDFFPNIQNEDQLEEDNNYTNWERQCMFCK